MRNEQFKTSCYNNYHKTKLNDQGGQKMAKEIPVDKLKAAVNALNTMLDPKIKMTARKKSDIIVDFKSKMDVFIEEDTTDQLPEVCVDFYNEFIADDDAPEEAAEEKAPTEKKEKKKDKTDKLKSAMPSKVGILDSIFSAIRENGPIDKAGILAELVDKFPDRDSKGIKNTINCQLTGKNRPWRLEKSRSCIFSVTEGKYALESQQEKKAPAEKKADTPVEKKKVVKKK